MEMDPYIQSNFPGSFVIAHFCLYRNLQPQHLIKTAIKSRTRVAR